MMIPPERDGECRPIHSSLSVGNLLPGTGKDSYPEDTGKTLDSLDRGEMGQALQWTERS